MSRPERIVVPDVGRLPQFSHASAVGDLVFVSGTLGSAPGGVTLVEGGVGPETRQTLENMRAILEASGSDLDHVVKVTVYLADMGDFRDMNRVYSEFFPDDPPARITAAVAGLALDARVEMECIAKRKG